MTDDWVALHVFYASDSNPILVEAVRPLVEELRRDELIDRWFFIKYWMEGPHLRVRFRPVRPELRDEVTSRATAALEAFLARRPALYDTDIEGLGDIYKKMYVAEYGEQRFVEEYGVDGVMPFRPNNSVALLPYEQEFDRYGGPVGMELAEWHFEHSSDLVAKLLATSNTHVQTGAARPGDPAVADDGVHVSRIGRGGPAASSSGTARSGRRRTRSRRTTTTTRSTRASS